MNKATAIAPANIAFIKYWGKKNDELRLPMNSSLSMNLDGAHTVTTVEFSNSLEDDVISSRNDDFSAKEKARMIKHLDRIRYKAGTKLRAKVVTQNSFPKGAGAASSASGFAALTVAATKAAGLSLSEKELTILARIGSGSACRSIPDGFVEWKESNTSEDSYAVSLFPSTYWDLCDVLVIADSVEKKVSTTEGMERAKTSPFFQARLKHISKSIRSVKDAIRKKDIEQLGLIIEAEAINMHAVILTQTPALMYWSGTTMDIIQAVHEWRSQGVQAYFTIDAGPNVHLICEISNVEDVDALAKTIPGVQKTIINHVADGTKLTDDHLF